MNNNINVRWLLHTTVTVKQILIFTAGLSYLSGSLAALYIQNQVLKQQTYQISVLTESLQHVNTQYLNLVAQLNSLEKIINERELQLRELRDLVEKQSQIADITIPTPETITYLPDAHTIHIILIIAGACLVLYTAGWAVGLMKSPWDTLAFMTKHTCQRFGYWNDIQTIHHTNNDVSWVVKIINNTRVEALVKYPGSGEHVDAFALVEHFVLKAYKDEGVNTLLTSTAETISTSLLPNSPEVLQAVTTGVHVSEALSKLPLF